MAQYLLQGFFFFFRKALGKRLRAAFIIGTLRNYDGNGNGNGNGDVRQNNNRCNEQNNN